MPENESTLGLLLAAAHWTPLHLLIVAVAAQRVVELRIARRNERLARERGAVEFGADHYPAIVALHTLWFLGMIVEIVLLTRAVSPFWPALLAAFLLAQALRYWAIRTLGSQWNTRILVVPGASAVRGGPYAYVKHPNYLAVVIELAVLPMMFGAYLTAVTAGVINLVLLGIRIRAEERALRQVAKGYDRVAKGRK